MVWFLFLKSRSLIWNLDILWNEGNFYGMSLTWPGHLRSQGFRIWIRKWHPVLNGILLWRHFIELLRVDWRGSIFWCFARYMNRNMILSGQWDRLTHCVIPVMFFTHWVFRSLSLVPSQVSSRGYKISPVCVCVSIF